MADAIAFDVRQKRRQPVAVEPPLPVDMLADGSSEAADASQRSLVEDRKVERLARAEPDNVLAMVGKIVARLRMSEDCQGRPD